MIKRILIITAVAFTISGGTAQAADVEDGGGQYPKLCKHLIGGVWVTSPNC